MVFDGCKPSVISSFLVNNIFISTVYKEIVSYNTVDMAAKGLTVASSDLTLKCLGFADCLESFLIIRCAHFVLT